MHCRRDQKKSCPPVFSRVCHVVAAITVVATVPFVVLTIIHPALSAVAAITPVTLFCNTADLLLVTLLERMAEFAFCVILNLTLSFLCKGATGH
jgi:hypothetical protein